MKKRYSLKSKIEFNKIINKGKRVKSKYFYISYKPSKDFKLGISIPKKLGNAVFRNKNKRIIKQIIPKLNIYELNAHVILIARIEFINLSLEEKQKTLAKEFNKIYEQQEKEQ